MAETISWKMTPGILGLTLLTVSPGVSGVTSKPQKEDPTEQTRAIVETVFIGVAAVMVTRSWWPLAGPLLYVAYDYTWRALRNNDDVTDSAEGAD